MGFELDMEWSFKGPQIFLNIIYTCEKNTTVNTLEE